ncbi:MAG: ATPase, T2SS/T4P/T4SS family [bacterium]|nr:ATPase, T2SS/T4P/T4SS family [bacterium]
MEKELENLKGTILIVEDNLFMAELLSEKFMRAGFKVVGAPVGKEGLEKMDKENPVLILLDLPLAGEIDGFELLKQIRAKHDLKSMPVVALFNLDDVEGVKKCIELGANACLVKAFTETEEILARIQEVLNNKEKQFIPKEFVDKKAVVKGDIKLTMKMPQAQTKSAIEVPKRVKAKIEEMLTMPEADVSIINLVESMMEYAYLARSSDIHLEPFDDKFIVRLRVDGVLHDSFILPKGLQSGVITRIKVLTGMRTDEHQTAQDGRFKIKIKDPPRQFDVRASIVPTYYGENAVLRLLAEQTQISKLDDLAFGETDKIKIRRAIRMPFGMILATGPTGSGKTTTLYNILREINTREVSIITIEDPIEYSLEGVDQIQVNNRTGLTFADGLRSILRQDPNIIMVGEIRDEETASIAVNAALTGHKLLSTLHTNDAATTLPRLLDMGVEPFLVASTVNVAIGQRLVRMLCQTCKYKKEITEAEFQNLVENIPAAILGKNREFYFGKGCDDCGGSGYYDRMGIYEVLEMNDFIREAVMRRADAGEVKKIAIKNGMTTLLEDGFKKALNGLTTIQEILRVVHE